MATRYWRGTGNWTSASTTNWSATNAACKFTGSRSGSTLTVTAVEAGSIVVGQTLWLTAGTSSGTITALGTGTGGVGTYTCSASTTLASQKLVSATMGASAPVAADDVYLDIYSSAGTCSMTVNASAVCNNLTIGGMTSPLTMTGSSSYLIGGSLSIDGTNLTYSIVGSMTFNATTTGKTISSNFALSGPVIFNGVGGGWTLTSNFSSAGLVTLTAGSLALATYNLTASSFSSSNSNTRTIDFGTSGQITVNTAGTQTVWTTSTVTGLTVSGSGPRTVNVTGSAAVARTIITGSLSEANAISFNIAATAGSVALTAPVVMKNLTLSGACTFPNAAITLYGGYTYSATSAPAAGTSAWTFAGAVATTRSFSIASGSAVHDFSMVMNIPGSTLQMTDSNFSLGPTRSFTHTAGTLDLNDRTFTVGSFLSSNANTRSVALGSAGTGKLRAIGSGTAFDFTTATNFTYSGTGKFSTFGNGSGQTFAGGGGSFPQLSHEQTGTLTISGTTNTFEDITNTVQPTTITLPGNTTTVVGALSISGVSGSLVTLNSSTASTATLLDTSGTNSISYCNLQHIAGTGGAVWEAFTSNGNVDGGSNYNWDFGSGGTPSVECLNALTFSMDF